MFASESVAECKSSRLMILGSESSMVEPVQNFRNRHMQTLTFGESPEIIIKLANLMLINYRLA